MSRQQLVAGGPPLKPLVEVEGLKKYFPIHKGLFGRHIGDVKAVDGVSFQIYPRETLGVVGESGCGKTTVGRTLLRLIEPTAGSARFDGTELFGLDSRSLRAMRRHMQIIFQDPYSSLNPRMTVGAIIGDALELHGLAKGDARFDKAKELLERVGLQASYINRYPHEFSGGQRQRIGIARAVALHPRFIVCDEAVSALDVSVQAQILNLLMDLQEEYQLSYMFIAHDLSVVRHISDRVAVMYLGRIVELSVCDDLYEAPLHPYTQALLSAIPHPHPGRKKERVILEGDVPNPINPPSGCHFHTRCPLAYDRCRAEAPRMLEVRDGHRVRCHLYEDAAYPAEPIPIGETRSRRRAAPAAASTAPEAPDETPSASESWDGSTEFDIFSAPTAERRGGVPVGIPEVLKDREGILLGPFGEIVDPEDSFMKTGEIPRLDALVRGESSTIWDETGPVLIGSGDEPEPSRDESVDQDSTETNLEMKALDPRLLEGDEEATIGGSPPPSREGSEFHEETADLPTSPDYGLGDTEDMEVTVDAPAPRLEVEVPPPSQRPWTAEDTGVMPPIHDEEGIPDDVSLHEQDAIVPISVEGTPLADEETLDIPTLDPGPQDSEPPPRPDDSLQTDSDDED